MEELVLTEELQVSSLIPEFNTEENEIIKCVSEIIPLTEADKHFLLEIMPVKTYKKGTILVREGQVPTKCYSIFSGCVRRYYLIDGEEKTTFFYTERQSIISGNTAQVQKPSKHYLSCVEDCRLVEVDYKDEEKLYQRFPQLETLCRYSMEENLGNYQDMLDNYITTSPEERYLDLLKNQPDLLNRVPQYQLASYLGVKPESLSRIRRRIFR